MNLDYLIQQACKLNKSVASFQIDMRKEDPLILSEQQKNNKIRILTLNAQLSSFTATIIILNPTVGSGWNFTWSLLICFPTLG